MENICSGVKFFGKNVCGGFYLRQLIFADRWKNRKKLNPHKLLCQINLSCGNYALFNSKL